MSRPLTSPRVLPVLHPSSKRILADQATEQVTEQLTEQVSRLLWKVGDGRFSTKELMALVGLSHRPSFLYDYLQPALTDGWLEMTHPNTPKSPRQRYHLTQAGKRIVRGLTDIG